MAHRGAGGLVSTEADVHGTAQERLIVLEEADDGSGDGSPEHLSAEGLLRCLAQEGNVDAKEALAVLVAQRSRHSTP
jgi:hypothetical protein